MNTLLLPSPHVSFRSRQGWHLSLFQFFLVYAHVPFFTFESFAFSFDKKPHEYFFLSFLGPSHMGQYSPLAASPFIFHATFSLIYLTLVFFYKPFPAHTKNQKRTTLFMD